ncbi:hypothetical protein SAMN06295974_0056 [Plantibacter flavus]|uniref:Uncharacterized protein n=1 Tax=Plantibacter flavus TaxID=150123 RepID=A0A3N2BZY6_9MICO|nr:hypothetical protein [Plantibacter flavus]ROR80836.1 hypothetical protein EDD42_0883 [Plantibacter flavus]SMG05564.1 hypothetical protein SAMN06295974_0056 [Plantibacter flavus]
MAKRPGGVTIVAVIVWIQGFLSALGGALLMIGANTPNGNLQGMNVVGLVSLILGIITIIVGVGLLRGSSVARVLTTIVLVLSIASAVYAMVTTGNVATQIISMLLAVIGLILLYTKAASDYFRSA